MKLNRREFIKLAGMALLAAGIKLSTPETMQDIPEVELERHPVEWPVSFQNTASTTRVCLVTPKCKYIVFVDNEV